MRQLTTSVFIAVSVLATGAALAQAAPDAPVQATPTSPVRAALPAPVGAALERDALDGRRNQKIERLRHEDAGSRIDELRVGGRMQSITVQPKLADVPAYEVRTAPTARNGDEREVLGGASGRPLWNVLSF